MTIDFDNHYKTMKKIPANSNYAGVTDLAKPKVTPPAPKQVDPHTAAAQTLKPGHDAAGHLNEHIAPNRDLGSLYPTMTPAFRVGVTPGYEHLQVDPKAQEAFIKLARELGLSQADAQKLADFHVRITFDPVKK